MPGAPKKTALQGIREGYCNVCGYHSRMGLGTHIRRKHGKEAWHSAVLAAKDAGVSDAQIGRTLNISFNTLSRLLLEKKGNGSFVGRGGKRVSSLEPKDFVLEQTTVWAFRSRGNWATHSGSYRGNWSPYIPRNAILRYSRKGDTVLDCFAGGGTTAVEALLLGRNFIGYDINPASVALSEKAVAATLEFAEKKGTVLSASTRIEAGDARMLATTGRNSSDLICTHPPYAGMIKYSSGIEGDLSSLDVDDYIKQMDSVIEMQSRVLRKGGKCVVLIGDRRREKRVVPLGFKLIERYLRKGFELNELVMKRQFNTRSWGLWYNKSVQGRFLLLAHEYLPVFSSGNSQLEMIDSAVTPMRVTFGLKRTGISKGSFETTSVWKGAERKDVLFNLGRLAGNESVYTVEKKGEMPIRRIHGSVFLDADWGDGTEEGILKSRRRLASIAGRLLEIMEGGSLLGIRSRDMRIGGVLLPAGLLVWKDMERIPGFSLKEIVILDERSEGQAPEDGGNLCISHSYLLIYERS